MICVRRFGPGWSFASRPRTGARQGGAKAGRQKAEEVCAVSHGLDGLAKIAEAPNLAGHNDGYLVEQITAFKTGERKNEMMSVVGQNLSPTDIEDLAAYYSTIEKFRGQITHAIGLAAPRCVGAR